MQKPENLKIRDKFKNFKNHLKIRDPKEIYSRICIELTTKFKKSCKNLKISKSETKSKISKNRKSEHPLMSCIGVMEK